MVLTLVSGRPISFTMDLYQPVYVPRPEVHLNLFGSLRPQVYGETLGLAEEAAKRLRDRQAVGQSRGESKADEALEARRGLPPAAAGFGGGWNLRQGVEAAARASAVGELFQYAISTPVSIARQHSALLPIVNAEIKGEKVAIYDESVQADHPLNGFKLRNTTDLFLMQGPITVFDGGSYAGDAMIESIPPHSERLISYAVDLDVEVAPQSKPQPEQIVQVQLIKGVMTVTRKYSRTHDYTIKNSGTKLQTVLVLYPLDPSWNLVEPKKAVEKTRDKYRFAVEAAPGKPTTLAVREERTAGQQIALTNLDENAIQIYLRPSLSDQARTALQEVVKRNQAIHDVEQKRQQLTQQIQSITQEQARIRQNMAQLDRTSDLYKRYVTILGQQEDQIARDTKDIQDLLKRETALRQALDDYLSHLNIT